MHSFKKDYGMKNNSWSYVDFEDSYQNGDFNLWQVDIKTNRGTNVEGAAAPTRQKGQIFKSMAICLMKEVDGFHTPWPSIPKEQGFLIKRILEIYV